MRLGFDLDGTIADLQGARQRGESSVSGVDLTALRSVDTEERAAPDGAADAPTTKTGPPWGLSARQQRSLEDRMPRCDFWERLTKSRPVRSPLFRLVTNRRWG
jgi:hypothetical protein